MEALKIIADLGFSIAAALAGGFFIIILLKYILDSIVSKTVYLNNMISSLDNRVKTINNEKLLTLAKEHENVSIFLKDKHMIKEIVVPQRLVNFVVK